MKATILKIAREFGFDEKEFLRILREGGLKIEE